MIKTLLKIGFSVSVIGYLASQANIDQLLKHMLEADVAVLAVVVLLLNLAVTVQSVRWYFIIKIIGAFLSFKESLSNVLIGAFFNQVLPSSIGGDAVRMWRAYKMGMDLETSINSVMLDRLTALMALVIMVGICTPVMYSLFGERPELLAAPLFIGLAVFAFTLLFLFDRMPARWANWRPLMVLGKLSSSARKTMLYPRYGCKTVGISVCIHLLSVLAVYMISHAMSLEVTFLDCLILVPPVILFSVLPISIAGWGVREGVMISAFGLIGIDYDAAFALSVLFGLGIMSTGLPGSIIWLFSSTNQKMEPVELMPLADATDPNQRTRNE